MSTVLPTCDPLSNGTRCDFPKECPPNALFDCDPVFADLSVLPAREGGTMVQWHLNPAVRDTGPYQYTLQVGNAGVDDRRAWRNVVSAEDTCFLIDERKRLPGVVPFTHYRVRLDTSERTYHSRPLDTYGKLSYYDWRIWLGVIRAENVLLKSKTGTRGLLFKRKISGIPCRRCRDHNTGETMDSGCPVCLGTTWVGGYYKPVPCYYLNVDPGSHTIATDIETLGPRSETKFAARAVASPILTCGDVWLNQQSSDRYRIVALNVIVEQKGVPAVYQLEMERLPVSDITYTLPRYAE